MVLPGPCKGKRPAPEGRGPDPADRARPGHLGALVLDDVRAGHGPADPWGHQPDGEEDEAGPLKGPAAGVLMAVARSRALRTSDHHLAQSSNK